MLRSCVGRSDEIIGGHANARDSRRLDGKRLRGRIPLGRHVAFGNRPLLDTEYRLARYSIQYENPSGFAGLG